MPPSLNGASSRYFFSFGQRRWKAAILLGISYLAFMWLSEIFLPHPATLFPSSAIALSALFLEGIDLWPMVYIAALIGSMLAGYSPASFIIMPIAQTLQAIAGAYLLRRAKIDPLFRSSRDIFFLIGTVAIVSLIVPTFGNIANALMVAHSGVANPVSSWGLRYTGTLFCLLIITPFLLRWFAKPSFSRTGLEVLETGSVFALLTALDVLSFVTGFSSIGGIPTLYFLLIPLFWIALRLRPRFVTLALLITSVCAIASLYVGPYIASATVFDFRLFQIEELMIVLAVIFFVMVSLEENRRLSANQMLSQVAALENANARISSESSAKNDFIAVLAHELRNPLAPIVSGIDYLKLKAENAPDELDTLKMMEGRMQTVRRLLDDLLDISRITEGKLALTKEHISLGTIMKRAIISTAHHRKERHQSFSYDEPQESLFIEGDPVRLEQVFSNLLTNASKYSDSGDAITVWMGRAGTNAEILISDTGVGIPTESLEKIFRPFHQIDHGERSKKGLGIGLALVRNFVVMHGGTVEAVSDGPGTGSRFHILLPLLKE